MGSFGNFLFSAAGEGAQSPIWEKKNIFFLAGFGWIGLDLPGFGRMGWQWEKI